MKPKEMFGRGEWIRTTDLLVPNQAALQPSAGSGTKN